FRIRRIFNEVIDSSDSRTNQTRPLPRSFCQVKELTNLKAIRKVGSFLIVIAPFPRHPVSWITSPRPF
ncbi:MAG: hypothetical protein ACKOAH_17830, partial [Pirellula sp.]